MLVMACLAATAAAAAAAATSSARPGYVLPDGSIQIVGWDALRPMFERLDQRYERLHPGVRLRYVPGNLLAPQQSLIFDETAMAPTGMEFSSGLLSAYRSMVGAPPFAVRIGHGAIRGSGQLAPLVFIVNRSNPLAELSAEQLRHVFTVGGRAPDIVTWGQAGVAGPLARQRIHAYGLPPSDHFPSEDPGFGAYLFRDRWDFGQSAPGYAMLASYAAVVEKVAADVAGIGVTAANRVRPEVKVLGVRPGIWGPAMSGSREEILSGRYPYDRYLYVYVRRASGAPIDPFVKAYLSMVLSSEGQSIAGAGPSGYLPLSAAELAVERAKLQ